MAKWFPTPEETFVFRSLQTARGVTILIPGGEEPQSVVIDGVEHALDEETTFLTRAHVRAAYERRLQLSSEGDTLNS